MLSAAILAMCAGPAIGQYNWTGNNNNNWDNNGNWGGQSGFPDGVTDSVAFGEGPNRRNIDLRGGDRDVASMTFTTVANSGYSFNSNTNGRGTLRINGVMSGTSGFAIFNDTIDVVLAADGNWLGGTEFIFNAPIFGSTTHEIQNRVTFNTSNPFTGTFETQGGTVIIGHPDALKDAQLKLNSFGTLDFGNLETATIGRFVWSGGLDVGGTALTFASRNNDPFFTNNGSITGDADTNPDVRPGIILKGAISLQPDGHVRGLSIIGASSSTLWFRGSGPRDVSLYGDSLISATGGTVRFDPNREITFFSAGPGRGAEINAAEGMVWFNQNHVTARTLSGSTEGTIRLDARSDGDFVLSVGELDAGENINFTYGGNFFGDGKLQKIGTGTMTLTGASPDYTGAVDLNGGRISLNSAGALESASVNLGAMGELRATVDTTIANLSGTGTVNVTDKVLSVGSEFSTNFAGAITGFGTGTFRKIGSGRLELAQPTGFTRLFHIAQGQVRLDHALALENATVRVDEGVSLFANYSTSETGVLGALEGDGNLSFGSRRLDVGSNNASTTFNGTIGSVRTLTKSGNGVLTLGSADSINPAENVEITGGQIRLGDANALRDASVVLSKHNAIDFNGLGEASLRMISGTGNLSLAGTDLTLTGNDTQAYTHSGVISGASHIDYESSSTLTLTGANTFTGGVTIRSGGLIVNNTTGLGTGTGTVAVDINGTIGGSGSVGNLSLVGTLTPGNSVGTITANTAHIRPESTIVVDIADAAGAPGAGWDLLNVPGGNLILEGLQDFPTTISLVSLLGDGSAGEAANFDQSLDYRWQIIEAASITVAGVPSFEIDASGFANEFRGEFEVTVDEASGDVFVDYFAFTPNAGLINEVGNIGRLLDGPPFIQLVPTPTPVPAPGPIALLAMAGIVGGARRSRTSGRA